MKEYPNRTGLLKLKEEIEIAEKGKEILQDKIESLITLFFEYIRERGERRRYLEGLMIKAFEDLVILESLMGIVHVKADAFSIPEGSIKFDGKKVMGIKLPEFSWEPSKKGFQVLNVPVRFERTKSNFEEILRTVLEVGGMENAIKILSEEIRKTRKIVNSLENYIIPAFRDQKRWIELRLEEFAREDLLRYKIVKRKLGLK